MSLHYYSAITPEKIDTVINQVEALFPQGWLDKQSQKKTNIPQSLDDFKRKAYTRRQLYHAIRTDNPDPMHPLAGAIFHARECLEAYHANQTKRQLAYQLMLVLTLGDIAEYHNAIEGLDQRVQRLMNLNWQDTLYELITAVSYKAKGLNVRFIPESTEASADIELELDKSVFLECKRRTSVPEKTRTAIKQCRSHFLDRTAQFLQRVRELDLIIRINVSTKATQNQIGRIHEEIVNMYKTGVYKQQLDNVHIEIEPWEATGFRFENMKSIYTSDIFSFGWNFDEWTQWDYILPSLASSDESIKVGFIRNLQNRHLVCIGITDDEISFESFMEPIRRSYKKQLRKYQDIGFHFLVNRRFTSKIKEFSEGDFASNSELFDDFIKARRRIDFIHFDLTDQQNYFDHYTHSQFTAFSDKRTLPKDYQRPVPLCLCI